ncbi:VOC family protein [Mycobacterium sp. IS-3022]|uniref:VOC family protein n=1 Tax=Mycobacterium sp. IS-3022 TaxID=1772277 RepID=UPI0009E7AD34
MTVLPGPIRQIGYVVTEIDRAIERWLELGVGPWFVMRNLSLAARYRGAPCEITQSLALSNSGDMQLELIQQQSEAPSIFTEFLDASGMALSGCTLTWCGSSPCRPPPNARRTPTAARTRRRPPRSRRPSSHA